jgi:hypothetical protein
MSENAYGAPAVAPGPMPTGGRWGWYQDGEREWQRVSTLIKKVETDRYNLEQHFLRQVAQGLAVRDDLVFAVKAVGPISDDEAEARRQKKTLNEIVKTAQEAAKVRDGGKVGTAVHTLTERVDRGEDVEAVAAGLPSEHAASLRAYAALRQLNGWQSVEIERTVVCDELDVAGTFDRIDVVPGLAALLGPGTCQHGHTESADHGNAVAQDGDLPTVVDVKTEAQPWLNGLHIGPQLAIYSRAKRMWIPGRRYVPAPCVRQDIAIVVHVRDGQAVPYFINLAEGWEAAQAAYAQSEREKRAKRQLGAAGAWFVPVPNVAVPKRDTLSEFVAAAAEANYAGAVPVGGYKVGDSVTVGGVEFTKHAELPGLSPIVEQVAVEVAPGVVDWRPAASELDDADRGCIEAIWKAQDLARLAELWQTYTSYVGRPWSGRVAEAGEARRRQIECVQRDLHTEAGTVKCACGWVAGLSR